MRTMKLEKCSQRRLDVSVMRTQIAYVVKRSLGGNRGKVWESKGIPSPTPQEVQGEYVYIVPLRFERIGRAVPKATEDHQWEVIKQMAENAGRSKGWTLAGAVPKSPETILEAGKDVLPVPTPRREYQSLTVNVHNGTGDHFSHLYNLDPQISIVKSAIEAFADSREDRFHVVLHGKPACGKTEILRSFARWLGPESVLVFDATSTTKAGAERILLETATIPPVLVVEEIEKTDEQSLRWLLGVLDHRGEVRKITHRMVANRSVQLLCLATVNDMGLFSRVMDGALASRFAHQVHCPRPSRETLEKILEREILSHKGNPRWIKPALDWCLDGEKTTDPRRVIAVCLSGKDKLLTREYQKALKATMLPE